ncbi:MAG: hypothetical protein JWM20_98 [Patescibacteria group bacterium]|nr:hypothetical protein [Patescibacteria group bacterium]
MQETNAQISLPADSAKIKTAELLTKKATIDSLLTKIEKDQNVLTMKVQRVDIKKPTMDTTRSACWHEEASRIVDMQRAARHILDSLIVPETDKNLRDWKLRSYARLNGNTPKITDAHNAMHKK